MLSQRSLTSSHGGHTSAHTNIFYQLSRGSLTSSHEHLAPTLRGPFTSSLCKSESHLCEPFALVGRRSSVLERYLCLFFVGKRFRYVFLRSLNFSSDRGGPPRSQFWATPWPPGEGGRPWGAAGGGSMQFARGWATPLDKLHDSYK